MIRRLWGVGGSAFRNIGPNSDLTSNSQFIASNPHRYLINIANTSHQYHIGITTVSHGYHIGIITVAHRYHIGITLT